VILPPLGILLFLLGFMLIFAASGVGSYGASMLMAVIGLGAISLSFRLLYRK
jgi:hypothetical protein